MSNGPTAWAIPPRPCGSLDFAPMAAEEPGTWLHWSDPPGTEWIAELEGFIDAARDALALFWPEPAGPAHARRSAGDASNRRYLRLSPCARGHAVLMDAPPDRARISARSPHRRAPSVPRASRAAHPGRGRGATGFLLLEDLGDDLFARVIRAGDRGNPRTSSTSAATDLLTGCTRPPPPGLAPYDPRLMADLAALAFDWYVAHAPRARPRARGDFRAFRPLLAPRARPRGRPDPARLPCREPALAAGSARASAAGRPAGFPGRDAGHRAYDLVSLLQDARRDVPPTSNRR